MVSIYKGGLFLFMVKQQLLERMKNLPINEQKKIMKKAIDIAIKMYQESWNQEDFDLIVDLYQPKKYIPYWNKKYGHLLDNNYDDFASEYMLCFVKACNSYKKSNKKISSYFNNYFFSTLSNHFKNMMSQKSCSKRNPSSICPLCNKEVAPLNTHILKEHHDLIEKMVEEKNVDDKCPFCSEELNGEKLYKHIASKHSSMVYEYFQKFFPNYNTNIQNPAPPIGLIYIGDETIGTLEDIDIQPLYYQQENMEDMIVLTHFSECQKTIRNIFDFYNISKLPSYKKICSMCMEMNQCHSCPRGENFKLTKQIYDNEIQDLIKKIKE